MSDSVTDKSRRDWRWLALGAGAVLALTAVAIVATIGLAAAFDVRFDALSRDPTSVYKGPVYAGWFSNLVTLLWQVPATCALLAAVVLRATRRAGAAMFLTAGLIGAVLAADDLFLIHELLAESVRLPDLVLPILYGIAVVAFMIVFRRALGTAGIALVAVALLLWTASIGSVVATQQHGQVLASALKLAGVGFWALLILRLAFVALRDLAGAASAEDGEPEDDELEDDEPEDEEPPVEPPAPKPAKKKPAKKATKKVEEPATVAVASAADLPEEIEPDDEEPEDEAPAPVPSPGAAVPGAAIPVAAPVAAPEPASWPPAAEPVDPVTEMQRVVPPLPPLPDPQPEPVTRPLPVTRVPDDTRTVAQPIVRAAPRPPADPGRGRRPEPQPPRRPVDPGPPPQRPGPPPAPQQQPSGPQPLAPPSAPPLQPPTGPEPAVPPAPPQPHPLASPPMPPAQPPPQPARPEQDGPRHRRT